MLDTLTIRSQAAAAALEHPRVRQIVLEVVADERSLQDLADATGLSLSLLHYHVTRLRRLGLVKVVRHDRRAGRAVKRYRAVARRFLVPAHLAKDTRSEALARELRAGLERDLATRDAAGVVYFVDASGGHRMQRLLTETNNCAFEAWITLFLTPHDTGEFSHAIRTLCARYSQQSGIDAQPVIAYCAFAPRASGSRRGSPR